MPVTPTVLPTDKVRATPLTQRSPARHEDQGISSWVLLYPHSIRSPGAVGYSSCLHFDYISFDFGVFLHVKYDDVVIKAMRYGLCFGEVSTAPTSSTVLSAPM